MVTIKGIRERRDMVQAILALALFFAAGVACVESGDQAPSTGSSGGSTTASLTGTVTTAGGAAVSGATVSVDRGDYSTTTNASGQYTLPVAADNTYNIAVTFNGYKTVVQKGVRVNGATTISNNITLGTLLAAGERTYVGSVACKMCHSTQHTRWQKSPHRNGLGAPGDSPGILPAVLTLFNSSYDLVNTTAFSTYAGNAPRLSKSGDTYLITIGNIAYPVVYAMGYQWKQRYITKIGEAHYILPIQYNVSTSEWVTYNTADWYTGTTPLYTAQATVESDVYKRNSWERKCMGCHSVTGILSLEFSNSPTSGIAQHRADWVERGIGCEACHGPGSAHVWGNGATGTTADPYIVNPAKLTRDRAMDVCGQCHSRGASVGKLGGFAADSFIASTSDTYVMEYFYLNGRTFRPGDALNEGYADIGGYWTDSYMEFRVSKQHHQQWNDMYQSAHLAANAADSVTCGSCHDVHGPVGYARQMKLSAQDNSICLTCHGSLGSAQQRFATDSQIVQHMGNGHRTYAPGTTGAGRCVTCHMVATAKTAINYDIRNHTFRTIKPHNTLRFARANASETIPNSCQQTCHNGSGIGTTNFGTGAAGSLLAAQNWDSTVERPDARTPDTPVAVVTGTVRVVGATSFADTFGVWVGADFTNYSAATNRNGYYYLALDAPGTYILRAIKPGYDSNTLEVWVDTASFQRRTINLTITPNAAASYTRRSTRCGACHGGSWGAEWSQSGFTGAVLSEAEQATDLSAGHSLLAQSPAGRTGTGTGTCQRCHEARSAVYYMQTGDTSLDLDPATAGYAAIPLKSLAYNENAGRRSVTCMVCHRPHSSATADSGSMLWVNRTTAWDTGYFYGPTVSGSAQGPYGSMAFPATYKASQCVMCHLGRTAPYDSGTGLRLSGGTWQPVSTPHVGNNSEGFFGIRSGISGAAVNFTGFTDSPRAQAGHDSDLIWGQTFSYQAFVYSGGAPKLVSRNGVPVVKQNERFTCVTCHMYSQNSGTHSTSIATAFDGGHSFKPDIRACGICHDPVYVNLNPYTNNLEAKGGAGDVGYWGTDSWGVSTTTGRVLGMDRPVAALNHQRDNGRNTPGTTASPAAGDGVRNDYDGNGKAEGAHKEAEHLFFRVAAAMQNGTHHGETSAIDSAALGITNGTAGLGDTLSTSHPYWNFNATRAAAGLVTPDELRVAWNLVLFEHDESNLGVHNLRFAVDTLRQMWTRIGRQITGDGNWTPPGDDY